MKIMATFDGSAYSEGVLPIVSKMSCLPNSMVTLLSIAHEPKAVKGASMQMPIVVSDTVMGRAGPPLTDPDPMPRFAETKEEAVERRLAETKDYLLGLAHRLPAGTSACVEAHVSNHPAATIIECAKRNAVDVIVMATHSRKGLARVRFGSTAEEVIRSGVAPVLVVHPTATDE